MWQTSTPDGATLVLRQMGGRWVVDYVGRRAEAPTAEAAIREVLQVGKPADDAALEQWISDHVAELDRDPPG